MCLSLNVKFIFDTFVTKHTRSEHDFVGNTIICFFKVLQYTKTTDKYSFYNFLSKSNIFMECI